MSVKGFISSQGVVPEAQLIATNQVRTADGTILRSDGLKNYIREPDADYTLAWVASGAGVTVGSTTTTNQLPDPSRGSALAITRVSGSNYVYYRFTLDPSDYNRAFSIIWNQIYSGSGGDYTLALYSNTASNYSGTSTSITLSVTSIPSATSGFISMGTFPAGSAPYMELRVLAVSGTTPLYLSSIQVSPITSASSFVANWTSGTTFSVTHNLGTKNVGVQIYDVNTGNTIYVDQITRTSANQIDLTASQAPTGSGWEVLILSTGSVAYSISGLAGDVSLGATGIVTFLGQKQIISPTSFSSSQNNYSPTGWLSGGVQVANCIRFTATAYVDITGLVPPTTAADGCIVTLENAAASTFPVRLVDSSGSSTAANQFAFLSNIFLLPGESLTINYDGAQSRWRELTQHVDIDSYKYGGGMDGNVTISSGTTTITRDMFYQNLTISGTGAIAPNGFKIYVSEMWDISAAPAKAVLADGGAGGNGSNATGGTAGARNLVTAYATIPIDVGAQNGGVGGSTTGTAGQAVAGTPYFPNLMGGAAGAGGAGSGGAGGAAGGSTANVGNISYPYKYVDVLSNVTTIRSSIGGSSGGGGGGDAVNTGGGGGGGGAGGVPVYIAARFINRGSNSTAGVISSQGGAGGAGATRVTGNVGGGGGGCGGSGGSIFIYYSGIYGSTITNGIDVTGGSGGNGGSGVGTGVAGGGGWADPGGYVMLMNTTTGVVTQFFGNARVSPTGATGGTASTSRTNI